MFANCRGIAQNICAFCREIRLGVQLYVQVDASLDLPGSWSDVASSDDLSSEPDDFSDLSDEDSSQVLTALRRALSEVISSLWLFFFSLPFKCESDPWCLASGRPLMRWGQRVRVVRNVGMACRQPHLRRFVSLPLWSTLRMVRNELRLSGRGRNRQMGSEVRHSQTERKWLTRWLRLWE